MVFVLVLLLIYVFIFETVELKSVEMEAIIFG